MTAHDVSVGDRIVLRVHFTAEDLARVQVATELDPLWETVLGLQQLTCPGRRGARVFRSWRRQAGAVVERRQLAGAVRMLAALVPSSGAFPDFLTPAAAAAGLDAGLDAVRGTSRGRLRRELRWLPAGGARREPVPLWLRDLAAADRDRMGELTDALRGVYEVVSAPHWPEATALVEADRALRARRLRDGGVHGLLGSLCTAVRWDPPVLHADYPVDRDLHLNGRGLRLVPSYFCWRTPVAFVDPELTPVLVYPIDHGTPDADGKDADGNDRQALPALLGRTRARVLVALDDTATTGELARRLRVSPASASQHVHVLAAANLVRSRRDGNQVLHSLTPLGSALLSGRVTVGTSVT
jgi:DNA-binding transcriptional ArsR family regulator